MPTARGAEAFLQGVRIQLDLAAGVYRCDDVLFLQSAAILSRRASSGTIRASGGAYEQQSLSLWTFGADGLLTRWELFDVDREADALARFDELTAEPAPVRAARRVRPNAATANAARFDAAVAARDADAFLRLLADDMENVHHPTGVTFDRERSLATWRSLLRARDLTFAAEPLATLGDSLALCRVSSSASGFTGGKFDVGAYELEEIVLIDVDAEGRRRRVEIFAADRLGDAVARLYERYAELLPDGPERERAAATARSVAAMIGPPDLDRWATAIAPDVEFVDRRTLGVRRHAEPKPSCTGSAFSSTSPPASPFVATTSSVCNPPRSSRGGRTSERSAPAAALTRLIHSRSGCSERMASWGAGRRSTPTATPRRSRASTS